MANVDLPVWTFWDTLVHTYLDELLFLMASLVQCTTYTKVKIYNAGKLRGKNYFHLTSNSVTSLLEPSKLHSFAANQFYIFVKKHKYFKNNFLVYLSVTWAWGVKNHQIFIFSQFSISIILFVLPKMIFKYVLYLWKQRLFITFLISSIFEIFFFLNGP